MAASPSCHLYECMPPSNDTKKWSCITAKRKRREEDMSFSLGTIFLYEENLFEKFQASHVPGLIGQQI